MQIYHPRQQLEAILGYVDPVRWTFVCLVRQLLLFSEFQEHM